MIVCKEMDCWNWIFGQCVFVHSNIEAHLSFYFHNCTPQSSKIMLVFIPAGDFITCRLLTVFPTGPSCFCIVPFVLDTQCTLLIQRLWLFMCNGSVRYILPATYTHTTFTYFPVIISGNSFICGLIYLFCFFFNLNWSQGRVKFLWKPGMFHLGFSWVTSCSLWKGSPALAVLPIHASLLPRAVENDPIKDSLLVFWWIR